MESRRKPPLFSSPLPSLTTSASGRRQRFLAHEAGAQAGEIAFRGFRASPEQLGADGHVQQRVAEKFQPLVVVVTEAAMSQGAPQQAFITKAIRQRPQQALARQTLCFGFLVLSFQPPTEARMGTSFLKWAMTVMLPNSGTLAL